MLITPCFYSGLLETTSGLSEDFMSIASSSNGNGQKLSGILN